MMKGSEFVDMNINIAGEIIKLQVKFDDQIFVREAERNVKGFIDRQRKACPEASNYELIAMAAYQYAFWYQQLLNIQNQAIDIVNLKTIQIDKLATDEILDTRLEAIDS